MVVRAVAALPTNDGALHIDILIVLVAITVVPSAPVSVVPLHSIVLLATAVTVAVVVVVVSITCEFTVVVPNDDVARILLLTVKDDRRRGCCCLLNDDLLRFRSSLANHDRLRCRLSIVFGLFPVALDLVAMIVVMSMIMMIPLYALVDSNLVDMIVWSTLHTLFDSHILAVFIDVAFNALRLDAHIVVIIPASPRPPVKVSVTGRQGRTPIPFDGLACLAHNPGIAPVRVTGVFGLPLEAAVSVITIPVAIVGAFAFKSPPLHNSALHWWFESWTWTVRVVRLFHAPVNFERISGRTAKVPIVAGRVSGTSVVLDLLVCTFDSFHAGPARSTTSYLVTPDCRALVFLVVWIAIISMPAIPILPLRIWHCVPSGNDAVCFAQTAKIIKGSAVAVVRETTKKAATTNYLAVVVWGGWRQVALRRVCNWWGVKKGKEASVPWLADWRAGAIGGGCSNYRVVGRVGWSTGRNGTRIAYHLAPLKSVAVFFFMRVFMRLAGD
jgi:hypothetical protein